MMYGRYLVRRVIQTGAGKVVEHVPPCDCNGGLGPRGGLCSECGAAILTLEESVNWRAHRRRMRAGLPEATAAALPLDE